MGNLEARAKLTARAQLTATERNHLRGDVRLQTAQDLVDESSRLGFIAGAVPLTWTGPRCKVQQGECVQSSPTPASKSGIWAALDMNCLPLSDKGPSENQVVVSLLLGLGWRSATLDTVPSQYREHGKTRTFGWDLVGKSRVFRTTQTGSYPSALLPGLGGICCYMSVDAPNVVSQQ